MGEREADDEENEGGLEREENGRTKVFIGVEGG